MKKKLQLLSLSCLLLASCLQSVQNDQKSNMIEHDIDIASQQIGHQVEVIEIRKNSESSYYYKRKSPIHFQR